MHFQSLGNYIRLGLNITLFLVSFGLFACSSSHPRLTQNLELIRASEKGQYQVVSRLIKDGADVNARDADGWTPYLAASSNGQFKVMRILVAFGAKTIPDDLKDENKNSHQFLADR